jgi:hypothetical protein
MMVRFERWTAQTPEILFLLAATSLENVLPGGFSMVVVWVSGFSLLGKLAGRR